MYAQAVKAANADIRLWANCENFTLSFADTAFDGILTRPATENTQVVTATLDRFVRQMQAASLYAENIITFSYNHYFSPELVNPIFIETYLDYLKNGHKLESEAPSAVENFKKSSAENGVSLSWDAASDNFGIAYYRIEKNGEFFARVEMCFDSPKLALTDESGKISDSYVITAFDAAGNASASSAAV